MSTTIGCPIPGASQPKEPARLIDVDELKKRAMKVCFPDTPECGEFDAVGVSDIDLMPTIDPESLRPTAHWISVKDRLPAKHERVLIYDSVCHNIYMAWRDDDLDVWFSEEYLPDFVYVTHWMPLPEPPEVTP